jgi:hypothetical protein
MTTLPIEVTIECSDKEFEENIRTLAKRHHLEILDLVNLVRSIVINEVDPIGGPFRMHRLREKSSLIIHRQPFAVPDPLDPSVDINYAWADGQEDLKLCDEILSGDPSMEQLIQVELNSYRWLRFWSIRDPDPVTRIKLRREVDARAESVEAIRAKAASMNTRNAALVIERLRP